MIQNLRHRLIRWLMTLILHLSTKEDKEVNKVLIILMAEQVLSGKIKIEQIGNAFNLRTLVEQKIAEMLGETEGE